MLLTLGNFISGPLYFLPFLLEQASVSPLWEPRFTSIVLTEIGLYRVLRLETEDGSNYWIGTIPNKTHALQLKWGENGSNKGLKPDKTRHNNLHVFFVFCQAWSGRRFQTGFDKG